MLMLIELDLKLEKKLVFLFSFNTNKQSKQQNELGGSVKYDFQINILNKY